MKLYRIARTYVGTQAEAKTTGKAQGAPWYEDEVPTDKAGLIAKLNALLAEQGEGAAPAPIDAPAAPLFQSTPPISPAAIEASATRAAQIARDITIEEAIAEADYPRALALAHQIHHRLMEHARAARA